MSQITAINTDTSDTESIAKSEVGNINNNADADLMAIFLATKADKNKTNKKKDQKLKQTYATKGAKIIHEIFDYIHITQCKRLFSLVLYNDLTYIDEKASDGSIIKKSLLEAFYNRPSCNNSEFEYL